MQALNPVPYPAQTANAIAWIAYSYVIVPTNKSGSALLFWVNELGVLFGLFFTLSCYGPAPTKSKDRILAISLFFAFVIPLIGAIGMLTEMSNNDLQLMWVLWCSAEYCGDCGEDKVFQDVEPATVHHADN
jgi:hypothetical protein